MARSFEHVFSLEHEHEDNHWWFESRLVRVHDVVRAHLPRKDGLILDLGCGSGKTARTFEAYGRVVGSDLSDRPLVDDAAKGRRRVASRAEQLPFRDGTFDLVTALDLVEHLEDEGPALREMFRVLRPGGILILTVPAMPLLYGPHDRVLGHWRRYSSAELLRQVRRSGGAADHPVGYFMSLLFPPLLAWRVVMKLFGSGNGPSDGGRAIPAWLNSMLRSVMKVERTLKLGVGSTLICVTSRASATGESAADPRPSASRP